MDRIIYTAGSGAARLLEQQAVATNNLANVGTAGFRAQLALQRFVPVQSADTLPTRVGSLSTTPGSNFAQGIMAETGRALDVAITGDGWFAVETPDGEAYTRAGEFSVNAQNQLVTATGYRVLSTDEAPIDIPERGTVTFGPDGSIAVLGAGDRPNDQQLIGQLKLVNPAVHELQRTEDGLFRQADGQAVLADESVRMVSGFIEKSNVSAAETLVGLIQNARQFEMQMKVIQHASTNAERANSILSGGN